MVGLLEWCDRRASDHDAHHHRSIASLRRSWLDRWHGGMPVVGEEKEHHIDRRWLSEVGAR